MLRQLFHDRARDFVAPLSRLIRVSSGADRDFFSTLNLLEIATEQPAGVLLGVDFALEINPVAQLHKFMRVAGVAIFAGKLASAIRVDRPGKWHARNVTAVQQRPHRNREVLDVVAVVEVLALRSQARYSHQLWAGCGRLIEQSSGGLMQGRHSRYSPFIRFNDSKNLRDRQSGTPNEIASGATA